MKIYRWCKVLFCILGIFLTTSSEIFAQDNRKVVFTNYTQLRSDYLRLLKKDGGISTFTSMSALKNVAQNLRENKKVHVELKYGKKRDIQPEEIIEKRKESVLIIWKYISATAQPEKLVQFATAIVLSEDGICASNNHVFTSMIERMYKLNPSDSLLFVSTNSGKLYPIKSILTYSVKGDLALFKLDTGNDKLVPFPIGQDLAAGAAVGVLAHPEGYPYFYSKGIVARNISTSSYDPFTNRTEITADYAKGSSGGAIFDDFGNLVAMVSSTRSIYYTDSPQANFQMTVKDAVPISSLLRVIQN